MDSDISVIFGIIIWIGLIYLIIGITKRRKNPYTEYLTEQIAIDCEMVGVAFGVNKSMLARVSLVNNRGQCFYDKYVEPTERILDYRTWVSGIRRQDLINATDFTTVQTEVAEIIKGRILVGHDVGKDLAVLKLLHPRCDIRDTSKYWKFQVDNHPPSLKYLAKQHLRISIQEYEHSSAEDARVTMELYRMFKLGWEGLVDS